MTADIESRLARIEAELAIRNLAARYARAVDSRNLEALAKVFAPTTNWGEHGIGEEGCHAFYRPVLARFYRSFHQIVGHVIEEIGEDTARGTVYCRAEHEDGENWVVNLMIYFDRYVRIDGTWHILGRRPRFLFVGDAQTSPRSVDFCRWPGREENFRTELPHSDSSWAAYWSEMTTERAQVTSLP